MRGFIFSLLSTVVLSGCASPAGRIAECQQQGGTEADCIAREREHLKAHPLPQYAGSEFDRVAALQSALAQSMSKKK